MKIFDSMDERKYTPVTHTESPAAPKKK
jgi:hypothetical protein